MLASPPLYPGNGHQSTRRQPAADKTQEGQDGKPSLVVFSPRSQMCLSMQFAIELLPRLAT